MRMDPLQYALLLCCPRYMPEQYLQGNKGSIQIDTVCVCVCVEGITAMLQEHVHNIQV